MLPDKYLSRLKKNHITYLTLCSTLYYVCSMQETQRIQP
jgi:hypothetical protein